MNPMHFIIALITGLAAGLHTSTWGMYKDSPHEGFTFPKYFRSTIIGGLLGPVIWWVSGLDLSQPAQLLLLWGGTYAIERLILEFYKTFLREEDQSKYFIPMQLHIFGKVVESRNGRLLAAAGYLAVVLLVGWGVYTLWQLHQAGSLGWHPLLIVFVIGSIGGWISAFGGAWKDAPLEGFQIFKFFRSPAFAFGFSLLAAMLTDNFLFITLCGIGYTIATIETYKTFFFPSKPRGKFAGKPIDFPEMLQRRQRYVPVFVSIWVVILILAFMAYSSGPQGLI